MDEEKSNNKNNKILCLLITILIIIIVLLLIYILKMKSSENEQTVQIDTELYNNVEYSEINDEINDERDILNEESSENTIISQIYIPKEIDIKGIPEKIYKKINVVGNTLIANVDESGKLQLEFKNIYDGEKAIVDIIKDEIVEVKVENVDSDDNEHERSDKLCICFN